MAADTNTNSGTSRGPHLHPLLQVALAVLLLGAMVAVPIVWITNTKHALAESQRQADETAKAKAKLEQDLKDLQARTAPSLADLNATDGGRLVPGTNKFLKEELPDRLADRLAPAFSRLGDNHALTTSQIEALRKEVLTAVGQVIREEQKQNEELRKVIVTEQTGRAQLQTQLDEQAKSGVEAQARLQQVIADEQKAVEGLRHALTTEQGGHADAQRTMETEQTHNKELQDRLIATYGVAERSLKLADELRAMYVQLAKRDSSALGSTMQTIKSPFRLIGHLFTGDITDSKKIEEKEKDIRTRFDKLCTDLQDVNPNPHLAPATAEQAPVAAPAPTP